MTTRVCPNCGFKVQNDLLLACPECRQLLGDDLGRLSAVEEKKVISGLKRNVIRDILFLAGALAVIIIIGLWIISGGLEKITLERIAKQFEEPRIQALLQDVAKMKTTDLMQRQADPELKRFRKELSERVEEFGQFQSKMRERLDQDYQIFLSELLRIQKRSKIFELGDMAIAEMSRSAYEELLEIVNEPSDPSLQLAAKSEVARVSNAFVNSSRTLGFRIQRQNAFETETEESDFSTSELVEILIEDPDWRSRAMSAQLLANRKELGVPEALLESMKSEENLEVLKDAIRGFESVTGYKVPDIFGYQQCSEWWESNGEEFNESLRVSQ